MTKKTHVKDPRKQQLNLPCFSAAFGEWCKDKPTPAVFVEWVAHSILASTVGRGCWLEINGKMLPPNLFLTLTAPPATGKSVAISEARNLIIATNAGEENSTNNTLNTVMSKDGKDTSPPSLIPIAPTNVTKAGLVDALEGSVKQRRVSADTFDPQHMLVCELNILASELGTFSPKWDPELMQFLLTMYDCENYAEFKRTRGGVSIQNPCLNFIAGTTPAFYFNWMPRDVKGTGWLSRNICVYSEEEILVDPFASYTDEEDSSGLTPEGVVGDLELWKKMVADLQKRCALAGKFLPSKECKELFRDWIFNQQKETGPRNTQLHEYRGRRLMHLGKLCMSHCLDDSLDMVITGEHFHKALEMLTRAEYEMDKLFSFGSQSEDSEICEACYNHFMHQKWQGGKNVPISGTELWIFLAYRMEAYRLPGIIQSMVNMRMIEANNLTGFSPSLIKVAQFRLVPKGMHAGQGGE